MISLISSRPAFIQLSRWTLRLTIIVILWGAFVRLSGSGDGCGESWPLCQGVLIPRSPTSETVIELLHRATSGIVFVMAGLLAWTSRRVFSRTHPACRSAQWAFVFMLIEAGLGAVLVLYGWVDQNAAHARILSLSLHLVNTFFLLSALACAQYFARHERAFLSASTPDLKFVIAAGFLLLSLAGVAGVLAAIANMLHATGPLLHGLRADFDSASPLLIRLRILHPATSLATAAYLLWLVYRYLPDSQHIASPRAMLLGRLAIAQVCLGMITISVGGLVVMKLLHLLVADVLVIVYATLAAELLTRDLECGDVSETGPRRLEPISGAV